MLDIVILTKGRLTTQKTLCKLPKDVRNKATLLVYPEEYDDHESMYGDEIRVVATPEDVKGIAARREWAVKNLTDGVIWMLDDDLTFHKSEYENAAHNVPYHIMRDNEWEELFEQISDAINRGFSCGGLFARVHPLRCYYWPATHLRRAWNNWWVDTRAIDVDAIDWKGEAWSEDEFCPEDFHVQAQIVLMGHPQILLTTYTAIPSPTQSSGGCSSARNVHSHNAGMERLQKVYGEKAVSIRKSKVKMDGEQKLRAYIKLNKLYTGDLDELDARYEKLRADYGVGTYAEERTHFKEIGGKYRK